MGFGSNNLMITTVIRPSPKPRRMRGWDWTRFGHLDAGGVAIAQQPFPIRALSPTPMKTVRKNA
jgi:hypothetical protein